MKSIDISRLDFYYKQTAPLFENFNLRLESPAEKEGRIFGIMGASGAGKSTFLKILLGIEKPVAGKITLYPEKPVISYVPQEPVLFEHLSVTDNARYFQFAGAYKNRFNETLYAELIEDLGLRSVLTNARSVTHLSGGQKQRLSLLRALSISPDFLFLDEPCNGLDAEVKRSFLNKLREIAENYGLFILYITHHKLEAQLITDEIIYLHNNQHKKATSKPARGKVSQFVLAPPVIEAANVFNFPDVKILPGYRDAAGRIRIADREEEITNYWLIRDENIRLTDNTGIPFVVLSKSDTFAVIRNTASDLEWMAGDPIRYNLQKGQEIYLGFEGHLLEYNREGYLIQAP